MRSPSTHQEKKKRTEPNKRCEDKKVGRRKKSKGDSRYEEEEYIRMDLAANFE